VNSAAARGAQAAALHIDEVSHAFGPRQALSRVGFAVAPGEFTVLLGLNGAGKTTLFALITRLYYSALGTITVYGHDIRQEPLAALAKIGVVFQQPTLDLDLSVEQNLSYHASLHGLRRGVARARIAEELGRADIAQRARDKVRELSGGLRRRVELARALVHRPQLLLLDEPTVGLDVASRQFLLDHVRRLCRDHGIGVLWATHLIDEARAEDRVVVLHRGRVLAAGLASDIVRSTEGADLKDAFDRLTRAEQSQ
jgi:ABC-2 type transport system ATP-binding protein